MATAFDRALELNELRSATDAYASRHGEPGSIAYHAAWLRFHQRINTIEDLRRLRRTPAGNRRQPKAPLAAPSARRTPTPKVGEPAKSLAAVA